MDTSPLAGVVRGLETLNVPPHVVMAGVTLALGLVLALLVARLSRRLVRAAAEIIARRGHTFDDQGTVHVEAAVSRTLYWIVVVVTVMAATETLGLPVVTAWLSGIATFLPRVAVAVVIAALGTLAGRAARHMVSRAALSARLPSAARLGHLAQIAILIGTSLVAIEQLGIEISFLKTTLLVVTSALLAGSALAFGLGSQHLVANILSAYYVQKLYQVGQTVRVGELEGRIARVTDTAIILDVDGGEVAVPARELIDHASTLVLRTGAPR